MPTLTLKLPDELLTAFEAKYPPDQREAVLLQTLIGLVQDDPYSDEAFAEDERRYQRYLSTGRYLTTEQVLGHLRTQLEEAKAK